jgi:hypothetical protein
MSIFLISELWSEEEEYVGIPRPIPPKVKIELVNLSCDSYSQVVIMFIKNTGVESLWAGKYSFVLTEKDGKKVYSSIEDFLYNIPVNETFFIEQKVSGMIANQTYIVNIALPGGAEAYGLCEAS